MIVTDIRMDTEEVLQEMEELLRAVAGSSPHRFSAVRYTHCREALLASEPMGGKVTTPVAVL